MKFAKDKGRMTALSLMVFSLLMTLLSNCGNKTNTDEVSLSISTSTTTATVSQIDLATTWVQIPISIKELPPLNLTDSSELNLSGSASGNSSASAIVINLSNCTSGLTGNNSSQTVLNVYSRDTGCLGKLTSFTWNSTVYNSINAGAVDFTSWAVGQTATFASSGGALIYVKVMSQLSSPILSTDYVSYEFTLDQLGTNSNGTITVSTADSITAAGQDAPNFSLTAGNISFDGVDTSGNGLFTFTLTCVNGPMLTGANVSYKSLCPTLPAGSTGTDVGVNFSYKLIAGSSLTLASAISAFQAGGDTTVTLSSTSLPAGNTTFVTTQMTGPGVISSTQNMILILQAKNSAAPSNVNYSSFQYFLITLPATN